jgi:hypothetical protein
LIKSTLTFMQPKQHDSLDNGTILFVSLLFSQGVKVCLLSESLVPD